MMDKKQVYIRTAGEKDIEKLVPVLVKYREFYGADSNDYNRVKEFISERISKGDSKIFIAIEETSKNICGFIQLYPSFSTVALKPQWILNDFYVLEEKRKMGIGALLMNTVTDYFRDKAKGFILVTDKTNTEAKKFYSKHRWNTGVYDFYTYTY